MAVTSEIAAFSRSARESPGPRDWILDLYGSFVREFGGWIAVADLLVLLESLGVNPASGRASLSRMKRRGEVSSVFRGTTRGYALTEATDRWFADGTDRIMGRTRQPNDGLWAIASFSVPEEDRTVRYRIRSRLLDLGYGQLSGGLMIAPSFLAEETVRALELAELTDYVDIWVSRHHGTRPQAEIVEHAWDLPAIETAYREYMSLAVALKTSGPPPDDEAAFVRYLVNVNSWRELPFMDPGIPSAYLPDDWPAAEARAMFTETAGALRPAAWSHFVRTASS